MMSAKAAAKEESASSPVSASLTSFHHQQHHHRSNRPGRAWRRRRRRLRDIQQAAEAIRQGQSIVPVVTDEQAASLSVLPSDRHQTWPAVLERRTFLEWTSNDERALVGQLGYVPGNVVNVASRVRDVACLQQRQGLQQHDEDEPVVVELYPIVLRQECEGTKWSNGRRFKSRKRKRQQQVEKNNNDSSSNNSASDEADETKQADNDNAIDEKSLIEPFPTMYWLTHQTLRILVSKLELEAFGVQLEKRLANDPQAMASMVRAHRAYGQQRFDLLTESDRALVRKRKWDTAFCASTRGVAGIRNPAAVKCLHAHVAHALSGGKGSADNVVGKWVLEAVESMLQSNGDDDDKPAVATTASDKGAVSTSPDEGGVVASTTKTGSTTAEKE